MNELLKKIKLPLPWQISVTILLGIFFGLAVYVIYNSGKIELIHLTLEQRNITKMDRYRSIRPEIHVIKNLS